ncbi:MAG: flagellin N-terminal helical domain-containing protein, partial [Planctomycetota bacterium]
MLAIKNNIMASNAARHLGMAYDSLAKSVERLASGLRINSAKDDAAGLAVRELIRADVAVLQQGARNAQDGISMVQTMEGAMAVMDTNLIRMKELAEQAATGSYSAAQRTIMDAEFAEMADEIERIAQATAFNDITMLDTAPNATNAVAIHVGTTTTIDIAQVDMTKAGLNIETGDGGWRLDALTANGVDATSDTWLTVAQGQSSAAATSLTLTISFEDNDTSA